MGRGGVRDKAVVSSFLSFDFFIFCQTCANACICFPFFPTPPRSACGTQSCPSLLSSSPPHSLHPLSSAPLQLLPS